MIKVIMGLKGMGKTKQLIEMVNDSAKKYDGNVVCIEKGTKLTYDIIHEARLIDISDFSIASADAFYGFISGLFAGNYDIHKIYIDSILKIIGEDLDVLGKLLSKIEALCIGDAEKEVIITVSGDAALAPESVSKYF